jgi:hypothetical protein
MRTYLCLIFVAACGSSSSTTDSNGSGAAPDCTTYCTSITANCTATHQQYGSMATCMASCAHFPVGTSGMMASDTLGCRTYHAGAAMADPVTHCVHAGPSGAGVCGSPCEGFCDLAVAECPTQYADKNTCMTACASMTMTPPFDSSIQSGNNLSCRIYHATAASTDPTTHCPHITAPSHAPCM